MPPEIKRKKSFGTIEVDDFSPDLGDGTPRAINIHLSFEEALKLHLGLSQILGHLNGYNRATKAGWRACVNLCLYPRSGHITINEGTIKGNRQRRTRASPVGDPAAS
jgi:hypothetical protein